MSSGRKVNNLPIKWFEPAFDEREVELVLQVLDSRYINDGEVTRLFERNIAELVGVKYCVAVTSGTAAIALALMGLGVGPGDEVLVPDFTFVATANAVRLAGAQVKLVDIEPARFAIDPDKIKGAVGSTTRAVVVVDVNGRGANYGLLEPLAKECGLFLVCDAAEGLGSKWSGRFLGSFGDAGCFSFSANKTVTTGQGGMVTTNNLDLYHRLLELKDQGRRRQGTGGDDWHPALGFNFKLTNLQAAVGLAQLEKLAARLARAKNRERWYHELLGGYRGLTLPFLDMDGGEILQWTDVLVDHHDKVRGALEQAGIGHRAFWYPLHKQAVYSNIDEKFPIATDISRRGIWLPSSFDLTYEQVQQVAAAVRQALL